MIAILKQERIEELVYAASAEALDHPEAFAIMAKPIRDAITQALSEAEFIVTNGRYSG